MKTTLFVCLGNICRSPMAEGVFKDLLEKQELQEQFSCDSAGTAAYHTGELADTRMRETAQSHGIMLTSRARKISVEDFDNFDYILAMDKSNYDNILALRKQRQHEGKAQVMMMRNFSSSPANQNQGVPDPYYGTQDGFEEVYQILLDANNNFLNFLKEQK